MKGLFSLSLFGLWVAHAAAWWPATTYEQQRPTQSTTRVPGSNNATYGPIPEAQQIFLIEYLEIAPLPIPTDKVFFLLLRGEISETRVQAHNDADLANATFNVTSWTLYPNGDVDEPESLTLPLRTSTYRQDAHLSIRNASGAYVDFLTMNGPNDILLDLALPGWAMRTGLYTFEVVAGLDDGTCLFAMSLTQKLKGGSRYA